MNRHERNAALRNASPRMYQDKDPEQLPGMGRGYWRLMMVIGIVAALLYFVATRM